MKLSELILQDRFESAGHEALLNVLVTASWLHTRLSATLADHGITVAQYNVLRVLRGSDPRTMTCREIGSRLLDRTPDVTRLLDRLEKAGLVARSRSRRDRRVVRTGITREGRDLLAGLDPVMRAENDRLVSHLTDDELARLSGLLERFRTDQAA